MVLRRRKEQVIRLPMMEVVTHGVSFKILKEYIEMNNSMRFSDLDEN